MTHVPFYIRLVSNICLEKAEALRWYQCVKENLPKGVINVIHTVDPQGDPDVIFMIHKETKDGKHFYEIPLIRDLIINETENIEEAYQNPKGVIETSSEEVKSMRQGPADAVVMSEEDYNHLCETLAKHQHQRWLDERSAKGWSFGLTVNKENKQHPLMRPWEQLPEKYRKVDFELPHLFMNMLTEHGYVVVGKNDLNNWLKMRK